jgi:hypothetical protein
VSNSSINDNDKNNDNNDNDHDNEVHAGYLLSHHQAPSQ